MTETIRRVIRERQFFFNGNVDDHCYRLFIRTVIHRMMLTRPSDTDLRRFNMIECVTVEILSVKRKYFFSLTF